jgi:hypothetical protein
LPVHARGRERFGHFDLLSSPLSEFDPTALERTIRSINTAGRIARSSWKGITRRFTAA